MSKKTLITTAVGSAFVASLTATPVVASAENPFALSSLPSGYQVADSQSAKPIEGKCGGMRACEGRCGLSMADADQDGKISRKEFAQRHDDMFTQLDANKDGFIDQTEMGKMMHGKCGGMK
jgi:uncharacterized low-complexity protein